ncbi:MAG: hypothetical protein V2A58_16105 [Planctomycetota bacterium]
MTRKVGPFAEVRSHLDRPSVVIDGKPFPPMSWMCRLGVFDPTCLGRPGYLGELWRAGVRIYFLGASAHLRHWPATVATVETLLNACPRAFIIFRVEHNLMPAEWIAAHPHDMFRFSDGTSDVRTGDYMDWASKHPEEGWFDEAEREAFFRRGYHSYWECAEGYERNCATSFASLPWRDALDEGLRSFIDRVQNSPFAENVIGYFHAVGRWESFVTCASIDYSPAMRAAFRRWALARYEGDLPRLRAAWDDPAVTFETLEQPSQAEAGLGDVGLFRSPAGRQKAVDYFQCHNEAVADTILRAAQCIKDATSRSKLAGFSYGYYMTTNYALTGHSALRKVLACPDVDFIESCVPYEGRIVGGEHPLPTVVESMKRAGKLFWYEADIRTHLVQDKRACINYGATKTAEETIAVLTREFAHYLTSGIQAYWFDQPAKYYDDPVILKLFARFQRIGEVAWRHPLGRTADVAYVIDEDSFFPVAQEVSIQVLHRQRIQEMGRFGSPYDVWLLDDLAREDFPDYRLIVFPNAFSLDDSERRTIRERLCRDGRFLLWHYAPGLINPDARSLSPENMASITGISFDWLRARRHLELVLTGEPSWLCERLPAHFTFGDFRDEITTGSGIGLGGRESITPPAVMGDPVFVVADPEATSAAKYTWDDLAGMAVKSLDGWTSIYAASLCLPHEVLANVAARAGVHCYSAPGDVVYANDRFLAIHTRQGGPRTIRLRRRTDVIDALSGRVVARDVSAFRATLADRSTVLYYLGSETDWPKDLACPWDAGP